MPGNGLHFHVQRVHRHPILEVAIERFGFLDQHHANGWMRLEIDDHFAERGAACLLRGFNVDVFWKPALEDGADRNRY